VVGKKEQASSWGLASNLAEVEDKMGSGGSRWVAPQDNLREV